MSERENRNRKGFQYSSKSEEVIDDELMQVRTLLLSLPKEECSTGFDFRLQKRLAGIEVEPRSAATRSWVSGWLGVGLGFACAAAIALFTLDFDGVPSSSQIAGSSEQTSPVQVADPVTAPVTQPETMAIKDSVPKEKVPTLYTSDGLQQASDGNKPK